MILIYMVLGYIVGSIPFSYFVPKLLSNIDVRTVGSGNAGVTNVVRNAGLKVGILSLVGDLLKGVIPTLLALRFVSVEAAALVGASAVFGHCYSLFLRFRGGKGIATSAGVFLVLVPLAITVLIPVQFGIFFATGYMGLASICSAIAFPVITFFMTTNLVVRLVAVVIALFVIFKHRGNIERMRAGTEKRFEFRKRGGR